MGRHERVVFDVSASLTPFLNSKRLSSAIGFGGARGGELRQCRRPYGATLGSPAFAGVATFPCSGVLIIRVLFGSRTPDFDNVVAPRVPVRWAGV